VCVCLFGTLPSCSELIFEFTVHQVEVLYLNPMIETTYTLWVRNTGLDQPIDTSALRVSLYTASGPIKTVVPTPPCGNSTHLVTVSRDDLDDWDDTFDDYHNTIASLGINLSLSLILCVSFSFIFMIVTSLFRHYLPLS
jgi:hypothetical protein